MNGYGVSGTKVSSTVRHMGRSVRETFTAWRGEQSKAVEDYLVLTDAILILS